MTLGGVDAGSATPAAGSDDAFEVAVIGAGPAGLSAALNLARARRRTLVLDSNRPRNAVTLASHGFLTRDGVSPMQLRSLGRDELAAYPETEFRKTVVTSILADGDGFVITDRTGSVRASTVLITTGVTETLPALPGIRSFYGTSIHSCIACDAYEYADRPIALLGETNDLAARAHILAQWSTNLIVFTNAIGVVSEAEEARLAERGIRVERRAVADVAGDRSGLTGVLLADGETIARDAIFVRPIFSAALGYAENLGLRYDADGFIVIDSEGRTSVPGVYAAGDSTPPGPQQLIVAAGAGGRTANAINLDLVAATIATRRG
ncbi:thioredoxin reductase [Glaciihabitans tibetensis]|uniref:Thioredoxin reductase n=1 Tax=Glaciihabitans tibetensis TaxID=1266600 RepID=A0A2T0VFZ2_9MICO|nr:NAD(P)/FAD-dependent oxidoreductase [Glaciihabitans tibetensis]PRY69129.1 thioredoxin reductase [Glaciihabitans tibetensis]